MKFTLNKTNLSTTRLLLGLGLGVLATAASAAPAATGNVWA